MQLLPFGLGPRMVSLQALRHRLSDRDRVNLERFLSRFDAGQAQQVDNQGVQPIRFVRDALQELLSVDGILRGPIQQGFDAGRDDRERRFQFMRHVGDEILAQTFQTANVGRVMQDQNGSAGHLGSAPAGQRQTSGMDRQTACRRPAPDNLFAFRFGPRQGSANDVLERTQPHDFPETPTDGGFHVEVEQFGGAFVGEGNALLGVESHNALDHAAEDGAQLLAIFFDLGELDGQVSGSCG